MVTKKTKEKSAFSKKFRRTLASATAIVSSMSLLATTAFAGGTAGGASGGGGGGGFSIGREDSGIGSGMGKVIGILLDICFYAGIALAIYGIYEIIMSFMQQQPEAKTKGIFMTAAGIILTTMSSIIDAFNLV